VPQVQRLEIKLYPSSVRRPQDIKPAKQHTSPKKQPSKKQTDKDAAKQQQQDAAAAGGAAGQRAVSLPPTLQVGDAMHHVKAGLVQAFCALLCCMRGSEHVQAQVQPSVYFMVVCVHACCLCPLCCQLPIWQSITELQSLPQQQQQQQEQEQLLTSPSLKYLLQQQPESDSSPSKATAAAPAGSQDTPVPGSAQKAKHLQQQQQQQQQEKQQKEKQQREQQQKEKERQKKEPPAAVAVELGSVSVALWWEPTRRSSGLGVAERVSFCLLPGEVKVRSRCLTSLSVFSTLHPVVEAVSICS
jgi:hypothetical protein